MKPNPTVYAVIRLLSFFVVLHVKLCGEVLVVLCRVFTCDNFTVNMSTGDIGLLKVQAISVYECSLLMSPN